MTPLTALLKKELTEVFGDRSSRRGGLVQAAVILFVLGVSMPYAQAAAWASGSLSAVTYFAFLPGLPAAVLAADAFAGERERRTLATLLASPVPESTLLFGKWLAAVSFGMLVAVLAIVSAHAVVFWKLGVFVPAARLALGALAASLGSTALMASITVVVSMKIGSARAAQQIASVVSVALFLAGGYLATALGLTLTWGTLLAASSGAAIAALAILEVVARLFRRDRLLGAEI